MSGESFTNIKGLNRTLSADHATEFNLTATEKMLIYAPDSGLQYCDVATVNKSVDRYFGN